MIDRYVFLKLKRREDRERVEREARRDLPRVPGVQGVRIGRPADSAADVWDVMFVVRFARLEDVAPYLVHPAHQAFVRDTLEPHVEVRKAWNFEHDEPE